MIPRIFARTIAAVAACLILDCAPDLHAQTPRSMDAGAQPGSVWREHLAQLDGKWRVTDPDVRWSTADKFLPNPIAPIPGVNLDSALSAELVIDFWNGHPGTRDKVIRLNRKKWIPIAASFEGLRGLDPLSVSGQLNLVVPVPLGDLVAGDNTLQGSSGDNPYGWGQWGWSAGVLRVFLDPKKVAPTRVRLRVPADAEGYLPENPRFELIAEGVEAGGITEVRWLVKHLGMDEDGDGRMDEFHGYLTRDGLVGHAGTATVEPFAVTWDTTWVPDQKPGAVAVQALVRTADGLWTASEIVSGLSLRRTGHQILIYRPVQQIAPMTVRNNGIKSAVIPIEMGTDLGRATEARIHVRTFNGKNHELGYSPMRINRSEWMDFVRGKDHAYASTFHAIDPALLQTGDNLVTFHSTTQHHGIEVLWPGPVILVRYEGEAPLVQRPVRSH